MGNGYREGERTNSVLINLLLWWETVLITQGKSVKHVSSLSLLQKKGVGLFSLGKHL